MKPLISMREALSRPDLFGTLLGGETRGRRGAFCLSPWWAKN